MRPACSLAAFVVCRGSLTAAGLWLCASLRAQTYAVSTVAGSAGVAGSVDATGSAARFAFPLGVALDPSGNLFVVDYWNHTIRKMTPAGAVTTFAGTSGISGSADGSGTGAQFKYPTGVAVDAAGAIYVVDQFNCTIRKISAAGAVATIAGVAGAAATTDGVGTTARFYYPEGIAVDAGGNLFIAESYAHVIRKIAPSGLVTTFAGTAGASGAADGLGAAARFNFPTNVALDSAGNLFVTDKNNHAIRRVAATGAVTTFAGSAGSSGSADGTGTAARFNAPIGVTLDASGNLIVADNGNHAIRKITSAGVVTTIAGSAGQSGSTDGAGTAARFNGPYGLAVDSAGNIYVSDSTNVTIRKLTPSATLLHAYGFGDGTASDAAGSANGTLSSGALATGGQLVLDGATGAVQFGTKLIPTSGNYSVTLFAQATALGAGYAELISQGQSLGPGFFIGYDPARNFRLGDNLLSTTIPFPADGAMHHYALTMDGTNTRFYIDGALAGTLAPATIGSSGDNTRLGRQFGTYGEYFAGKLDAVRIYSGVLTATEIASLFIESIAVTAGGRAYTADHLTNAARGTVTAALVYGGQGTATDVSWNGKIVLLDRGTGTFYTKARNVQLSGGVACVIVNNVSGGFSGSFGEGNYTTIPAVSVSQEDGVVLKTLVNSTATISTLVMSPAPTITTQPQSQAVVTGGSTTLSVAATGLTPMSYQWRLNGNAISGATSASLALTGLQTGGNYAVTLTNASGTTTSDAAAITVSNSVAPRITTQPLAVAVSAGQPATLSVAATGGSLSYQWQLNGANLPGATSATLALASMQPSAIGDYTVVVSNSAGSVTSSATTVSMVPGRLINLSILTPIAAGDPLTVGTVIGGKGASGPLPLLIRGMGPSLTPLGVGGALADPKLEVFSGSTVVANNDNWGGTAELDAFASLLGAFPFASGTSKDAALSFGPNITAPPAAYTVQISGVGAVAGTALAEVYDGYPSGLITTTTPRLVNMSVLKQIPATGSLTAGFVVGGTTPKQLLIRAIGPALGVAPFNVGGVIPDPKLTLFDAKSNAIATNDNWAGDATLSAAFASAGAFVLPATSRDAALLVTLAPGSYTAQIAPSTAVGAAQGGLALVEVYDMEGGAAPAFSAPPTNLTALAGAGAMFSTSAVGAVGFQWQRLPAGSATWINLSGGGGFSGTTTATLFASAAATQSGDQFRVVVTNSAGATRSNPVTLTLTAAPSAITITGFTAPSVPPLSLITIPATGLTAEATTFVEFSNSAGALVAQVPATEATATSVTVAVPYLLGSDGTTLVAGTLLGRIGQFIGGRTLISNSFTAVQLQAAPASKAQAGALALSLLQAELDETNKLLAELPGSSFDSATTRQILNSTVQSLTAAISSTQRAMTSGSDTFTVGPDPGTAVTLTARDLQALDNVLLASLQATLSGVAGARSTNEAGVRAASGLPADTQAALNALVQAAASGASNLGSATKNFISTVRGIGVSGAGVLVVEGVAISAAGAALGWSLPVVAGVTVVAGLASGAAMRWHQMATATQGISEAPPANQAQLSPRAAALWLKLLQAAGPPAELANFYKEMESQGVAGLVNDAYPNRDAMAGGYFRIAVALRHGARGFAPPLTKGFKAGPTLDDKLRFDAPQSDPSELFNAYPAGYYPFNWPCGATAQPQSNSVFTGWRVHSSVFADAPAGSTAAFDYISVPVGDPPSSMLELKMPLGGLLVIATFDEAHTLTLAANPGGGGSFKAAPDPAVYLASNGKTPPSYLRDDKITVTVTENPGYVFASWSDLAAGDTTNGKTATIVIGTTDRKLTANFNASALPSPSAPPNLTANAGNQQVSLSWSAVTGATSYNVKRASTSGGAYATIANGVTATTYTNTGLTNGTTYYYVVTAVNSGGESGNSNQASATPAASGTINLSSSAFTGYFAITYRGTYTRSGRSPVDETGSYWIRHDGDGVIKRSDNIGTLTTAGVISWGLTIDGSSWRGIRWSGTFLLSGQDTHATGGGSYGNGDTAENGDKHSGTWTARWSPDGT